MKKLLWFAFLLSPLFIYPGYYQLWHHSKQVNSNIYFLNKVLNSHLSDIWTVKFSPNGNWLASGSVDSTVKIWNKDSVKVILTIKQPNGITSLDFSSDGNYLATASYDAKVRVWKLPEGLLVKEFIGHTGTVWSVTFSQDGKTIASCGEDATIKLWNVETGQIARTFQGHTRNVWDVKFSPDGNYLASGSFDKTIRIWNLMDGRLLHILTNHTEAIVAIAFSPDGQKLVSTSDDKTIKLWNTNNWSLFYSLTTPEHNQAADFSPDSKLLLTGGRDKAPLGEFLQNIFGDSKYNKGVSMRLWDAQTGHLLQTFSKHSNDVNDVSFSPDGKSIASASSDRTIQLWQINKEKIETYEPGFKTIQIVDRSRIYKPNTDTTDNLHFRPLDIDIWYPARASKSDSALLFRNILGLLEKRANYYTGSNKWTGVTSQIAHSFCEGFKCSDTTKLLNYKTQSYKDANPATVTLSIGLLTFAPGNSPYHRTVVYKL